MHPAPVVWVVDTGSSRWHDRLSLCMDTSQTPEHGKPYTARALRRVHAPQRMCDDKTYRCAHQKAAAIMTENMPHSRRSGVPVNRPTLAMLDRIVSAEHR